MDLHTNYPYALILHGIINNYPSLQEDQEADVAIIGAGITGALVLKELVDAGFNCVILDKRHAGMGSTAASTSLIQYETDVPLRRLRKMIGDDKAAIVYRSCLEAVKALKKICRKQFLKILPQCSGFA